VTLLHQAGLLGWQLDVEVVLPTGRYRLDLAFVRERIAVEVDGWAWHSDVERFRADRRRQNALVLAGWTVLRFTWDDLTNRPEQVVAQIQAALAGGQLPMIAANGEPAALTAVRCPLTAIMAAERGATGGGRGEGGRSGAAG